MRLSAEETAQYNRDGYFVARGLFSRAEMDRVRDAFMEVSKDGPVPGLSEIKDYPEDDPLLRYPRMMHPHRHDDLDVGPLSMRCMLDARVHDVLCDLFGEEPVAAQSMFYFKPAGARGQDLHQDNFYLKVAPGTCIAAWTAVDDADRENGGLVVVPGSHRLGIYCPEQADPALFFSRDHVAVPKGMHEEPVDLRSGDVLFFNGSVIHASYPNTTRDRYRRAFICHYVPASCSEVSRWYRPLLDFEGREVQKDDATGGGPCGAVAEAKGPH